MYIWYAIICADAHSSQKRAIDPQELAVESHLIEVVPGKSEVWELTPSPLEEEQMVLTAEQSLRPQLYFKPMC